MDALLTEIFRIQQQYWTVNNDEKENLLSQFPDSLDWKQLLRLHHLLCMEVFQAYIAGHFLFKKNKIILNQEMTRFLQKSTAILLSDKSPYRPQQCEIKFDVLTRQKEFKRMEGTLINASLTHLGCIEIIRLDPELHPVSLDFLPLSLIKVIMNNTEGSLVSYRDRKEKDICYLASYYYFSQESKKFINNTHTEYVCPLECDEAGEECGIGLGIQEFLIIQNNGIKEYIRIYNNALITMIPYMYDIQYRDKAI